MKNEEAKQNTGECAQADSPTSSELRPGVLLHIAGALLRISPEFARERVVLIDIDTQNARACSLTDLEEILRSRGARIVDPSVGEALPPRMPVPLRSAGEAWIESIPAFMRSDKAIETMLKKRKWVQLLKMHGVRTFVPGKYLLMAIKEVEHKQGEPCPFSQHTLYAAARHLRRNDDDPRSLLPQFHRRGGPGESRIDPTVEQFISSALLAAANPKTGRLSATKVYESVLAQVQGFNHENPKSPKSCPSYPTVGRRFHERFSAYDVVARNYGKVRAEREFRQQGARIRAEQPLDVVQYDDKNTGVFLIDASSGLPWGRSWLTAGVDEKTGAPLGIDLSERPRSTESALMSIIDGIFPKDPSNADLSNCLGKWEWYGHPGLVILDNASYNSTIRTQASVLEFDCELGFARPHHPTDKADIEHFNCRFLLDFLANEPGWAGPKEDREMLERGLGTAVWTLQDFRRRMYRWIVDDYSNKPLYKTGISPREAWRAAFALLPPFLPKRRPTQELMGTVIHELKFRASGGLLRMGLRYQSEELEVLRRQLGKNARVAIRYALRHVDYLYVLDPFTGNYLRVPCIEDPRYLRGITDWQQRLIVRRAYAMKRRSPGFGDMCLAREALATDTATLSQSKKIKMRSEAVIIKNSGVSALATDDAVANKAAKNNPKPERVVCVSQLEEMVLELSAIDDFSEEESLVLNIS